MSLLAPRWIGRMAGASMLMASCAEAEELGAPILGLDAAAGAAGQVPTGTGGESGTGPGGSGGSGNVGTGGQGGAGGSSGGGGTGGAAGSTTGGSGGGSGSSGGPSLFFDDFETGNASQWIAVPPTDWSVVSSGGSRVYQLGAASNTLRVATAGNASWTDQTVEARMNILSFGGGSTSYLAAIYARFKDLDNHYYLAVESNTKLSIRMKSGGSNTRLSSAVDSGITVNTWHTLKLQAKGSTLSASVDGVEKATFTNASIPSGGIGVGCVNASAQFDDVRVTLP